MQKVLPDTISNLQTDRDVDDTEIPIVDVSFGGETAESPIKLKTKQSGDCNICRPFDARSMWRLAYLKLRTRRALQRMQDEVLLYGTNELLSDNLHYKSNIDELLGRKELKQDGFRQYLGLEFVVFPKKSRFLFDPSSRFKAAWNIVLVFLLIYTAFLIPYRLAFEDPVYWDAWTAMDVIVDCLFLADIAVTLNSSFYRGEDGTLVQTRREIALCYVKSWLLIDLVSSFPYSFIDYQITGSSSKNYNNTARLTRLPRLYKLVRISRIAKAVSTYSNTNFFSRIEDCIHINSRIYKLCQFFLFVSVGVHIIACLWYLTAQLEGDIMKSWLARYHYMDSSKREQYVAAVYWAVTTVVTVGYGDISAKTPLEKGVCILWMIFGVGFYSYTIGSLSSFLTSIDTTESILNTKMAAVQEFARETGISFSTRRKMRNAIRYRAWKSTAVWNDKNSLFRDLPKRLRHELAVQLKHNRVKDFPLFIRSSRQFLVHLLPLFKPQNLLETEVVYRHGDHADEVYFITKGRANFVLNYREIAYKSYVEQSYFGEIEVLKGICRLERTQACTHCEFLVIAKNDFIASLAEFPNEKHYIQEVSKERIVRHKAAILELYELIVEKIGAAKTKLLIEKELLLSFEEKDNGLPMAELRDRLGALEQGVRAVKSTVTELQETLHDLIREVKGQPSKPRVADHHMRDTAYIEILDLC